MQDKDNMKRIALLMGLAVTALSSCTKDTVKEVNTGHAIDFHVSAQTRASEITTGNLNAFYVTALNESGAAYFEDQAFIRGANDVFISTPSYYWPSTGTLSFYAYAPADDNLTGTLSISGSGKVLEGFSPAETIADQEDFIVAKATGSKTNAAQGVALEFSHMLSQIEIHAKNAHEGYRYLVKGVRITDVVSSADFDFETTLWTLDEATTSDYEVRYADAIELDEVGNNVMGKIISDEVILSDNAMLIPQDLKTVAPDAKIGLYVQAVSQTGVQVFPENGDYDWMEISIDTEWEKGCKYVYTLDLTQGAALGEPIKFTMNVTQWNESSTFKDDDIDVSGTWRMARMEYTDVYDDGRPNEYEIYDTEEEIRQHLADNLYVLKVIAPHDYFIYPGEEREARFYYEITDGNLIVRFPDDSTDDFLIRDISENFVTYTKTLDCDGYTRTQVFYYIRIEDKELYREYDN